MVHANTILEYPLLGRVFRMLQSQVSIKIMSMLAGWLSGETGVVGLRFTTRGV